MTAPKIGKPRRRRGRRDHRAIRVPVPATFEFVTLRLGTRCVAGLEIVSGRDCLIDELPDGIEREALRAWLVRQGLSEIRMNKIRSG